MAFAICSFTIIAHGQINSITIFCLNHKGNFSLEILKLAPEKKKKNEAGVNKT